MSGSYLLSNFTSIVFISPEKVIAPEWSNLFKSTHFLEKIVGIAFDEAHTIKQW
jgi:superfamily II DNA helicase RecQ